MKESFKAPVLPEGVDVLYVADLMTKLKRLATEHKLIVLAEQDLAVTKTFKKTDFFADDVFFRARADLLMIKPGGFAVIGDWKTGKIYDYSKDQMRLEALLVSALYNIKIIHWRLFYVDQGKTVQGLVNLSQGLGCVKDLTDVMHEMQQLSASNGPWLAKKNKFCKWCDWYHKDECKESEAW